MAVKSSRSRGSGPRCFIVARQVSCHPAEITQVVLQWHEKSPWSREERSITKAELELAFCNFVQGKRLANLTVLGVSPAPREWHGDRLNCPCSLWLLSECTLFTWARGPSPLPRRGRKFQPPGGYLVDPASSHMLVSKIKPCMSKYELLAQ